MRLTLKRLRVMESALSIILAGEEGEGDAADLLHADVEGALDWVRDQIDKREEPTPPPRARERSE